MASYGKRLFRVFGFPLFYLFLNLHSLTDAGRSLPVSPSISLSVSPSPLLPVTHHSTIPVFHSSSIPSFQYSILPVFHHSSIPFFQYSIIPLLLAPTVHRSNLLVRHSVRFAHRMVPSFPLV